MNIAHGMVSVEVLNGADCPMFILPNPCLYTNNVACNTRIWFIALALDVIVLVGAIALAVVLMYCCSCVL